MLGKSADELYSEVSDLIRPKRQHEDENDFDLEELYKIEFSDEEKANIRFGIQMLLEHSYEAEMFQEYHQDFYFDAMRSKQSKRIRKSYTPYQIFYLEKYFTVNKYPNSAQKRLLATELDITELRVKTWFQNRRQKMKKEDQYGPVMQMKKFKRYSCSENEEVTTASESDSSNSNPDLQLECFC